MISFPFQAILFDLDGTLVETNIDFALMKREMLAIARREGLCEGSVGQMDILAILYAAMDAAGDSRAGDIYAGGMKILQDIEMRHAQGTAEIPFAHELIDTLRLRGAKIGIVTRNCRAASELSLGIVGIRPDYMVCREDSRNHKPHPDPMLLALERLQAQPNASVMIGDHTMDIISAKSAGLRTIGFLRDERPRDFFDSVKPDAVILSLQEAMDAIDSLDS